MREILFKAKRADNGEWVCGYFYEECGATYIIEDRQKESMLHRNLARKVNPETVCQYTGIDDKNGVKIWEGSRIKSGKFEYCIVFENGAFYANCINLNDFDNKSFRWILARRFSDLRTDYEVIGNIHD